MPTKILVLEDKLFMARFIQLHLERAGYELIRARNQDEAIDAMKQQSPELVVLDGQATLPPATIADHLPTIHMSNVPDNFGVQDKNASHVVLTKPFSPTHFVAEVKRLVTESKLS